MPLLFNRPRPIFPKSRRVRSGPTGLEESLRVADDGYFFVQAGCTSCHPTSDTALVENEDLYYSLIFGDTEDAQAFDQCYNSRIS